MLPYYKLSDFVKLRTTEKARNYMAECPQCKKKHLSINKKTGVFHCFTPSCNFNGICDDFKAAEYQHDALGERAIDRERRANPQAQASPRKPAAPPAATSAATSAAMSDATMDDYLSLEPSGLVPIEQNPHVMRYLESQQIPLDVAQAAGCMAATKKINDHFHNCLCYVNRLYGNIINVKYRAVDEKIFLQDAQPKEAEVPSAPFGIDCLNPLLPELSYDANDDTLIVTEGEKDMLMLRAAGFARVISTPNGALSGPEAWTGVFAEWLEPIRHVIVCGDADRAGRVMKRRYMDHFTSLGKDCHVATLSHGCKDIAECAQRFGLDEVRRIIGSVPLGKSPDIMRVSDIRQRVKAVLRGEYDHGYSIGYGPLTDRHFWLTDEGGLIVVTGKPNSGKTDWMRATLTHLMMDQGKACVFCSFEEPNKEKHVRRVLELVFGTRMLSDVPEAMQDEMLDKLDGCMAHLVMEHQPPTPSNIIEQTEVLMDDHRMPVKFLCIDPYLFVESEEPSASEPQQIKGILTKLQKWGRRRHVWVCVVAHPRKLVKDGTSGEYEEIDEYTVAGSAHWANLADFLLSVKRVFPQGMGNEDDGSENPSYTVVSMLKVRDQELCHTGRMYFTRQPCARYDERKNEEECLKVCREKAPSISPQGGKGPH